MKSSNPEARAARREFTLAGSVVCFCGALLCFMLGWAQGVRHDTRYLHIPQNAGWVLAAAIFAGIGLLCLAFARVNGGKSR
ncbi:MAG TPA: hypothetical protein VGG02_13625 [Chthoniobacterales bacterium]|jgi:Na+-transporting NADH:ubiquinone oxidoreductase subunit NqrE